MEGQNNFSALLGAAPSEEVESITIRDRATGQLTTFERRGDGYVMRVGEREVVRLELRPDGSLKPVKLPGRQYDRDPWDCYEKCMESCGSTLYCATGCSRQCGIT